MSDGTYFAVKARSLMTCFAVKTRSPMIDILL